MSRLRSRTSQAGLYGREAIRDIGRFGVWTKRDRTDAGHQHGQTDGLGPIDPARVEAVCADVAEALQWGGWAVAMRCVELTRDTIGIGEIGYLMMCRPDGPRLNKSRAEMVAGCVHAMLSRPNVRMAVDVLRRRRDSPESIESTVTRDSLVGELPLSVESLATVRRKGIETVGELSDAIEAAARPEGRSVGLFPRHGDFSVDAECVDVLLHVGLLGPKRTECVEWARDLNLKKKRPRTVAERRERDIRRLRGAT